MRKMLVPRVLILWILAQTLLLVSANEDAKREANDFVKKAVRLSLMALPSVRDARSHPSSSVSTGALVHPWISHVYKENYDGAIADIIESTRNVETRAVTSILFEIPKAMAMISPAAAVAGEYNNNPSAAVLFQEPIKKSTADDLAPNVAQKVNQIAAHIDSVLNSADDFFLNKLPNHNNVDADRLRGLKMLFLYGCFYTNLQHQLETVGLKADMNMNLYRADRKALRDNFMPYWLGTIQPKLVNEITERKYCLKEVKYLTKEDDELVHNWVFDKQEVVNKLNKCKQVNTEKTGHLGHKGQTVDHHKAAEKSGKTRV